MINGLSIFYETIVNMKIFLYNTFKYEGFYDSNLNMKNLSIITLKLRDYGCKLLPLIWSRSFYHKNFQDNAVAQVQIKP